MPSATRRARPSNFSSFRNPTLRSRASQHLSRRCHTYIEGHFWFRSRFPLAFFDVGLGEQFPFDVFARGESRANVANEKRLFFLVCSLFSLKMLMFLCVFLLPVDCAVAFLSNFGKVSAWVYTSYILVCMLRLVAGDLRQVMRILSTTRSSQLSPL